MSTAIPSSYTIPEVNKHKCKVCPIRFDNLSAGKQHEFQVRAVDTLGNKDPNPPRFSWPILTPAQGITQLIQLIKSMSLEHGIQTSLIAHLDAALKFISHGSKFNFGACIQLDGFPRQVQAAVLVHRLSTADALQLIQSAEAIQNGFGM